MRHARWYDALVMLLTLGRARAVRKATIELAHPSPGEAVLDVGCGTGDLTMLARKRVGPAGHVSGIDAAPEMIAVARRKASRAKLDIDYQLAAVEAPPFPDSTFDLVLSSLMMHHLPDDLKRRGLAEIHRVLKPGGRLLVVELKPPSGPHPAPAGAPVSGRFRLLSHLVPAMLVHRHMRDGTPKLLEMLTEAGFTSIEFGPMRFSYLGFVRARVPG